MSDTPKREDHYLVRGQEQGRTVTIYAGPDGAGAEKSRQDAERSGRFATISLQHFFIYPPPERNEACRCKDRPFAQIACSFGHMTECHYPQTCTEAQCSHLAEYDDQPEFPGEPHERLGTWLGEQMRGTDTAFSDSPEAGEPSCLCSRCGLSIGEEEVPVRAWPDDGTNLEFRYHARCLGLQVYDELPDSEEEPGP